MGLGWNRPESEDPQDDEGEEHDPLGDAERRLAALRARGVEGRDLLKACATSTKTFRYSVTTAPIT